MIEIAADASGAKQESAKAFARQMKFAVFWALVLSLLMSYNLATTTLWTMETSNFFAQISEVITAANEAKKFHIGSSTSCNKAQFTPVNITTTRPTSNNPFAKAVKNDLKVVSDDTCFFNQCVFDTNTCAKVNLNYTTNPTTGSKYCDFAFKDITALSCSMTNQSSVMNLCFLYGPMSTSDTSDFRLRVMYDAFYNYFGSNDPIWKKVNCSIKTWSKTDFALFELNQIPIKVNIVGRIVDISFYMVYAKEALKAVILIGSLWIKQLERTSLFVIALNSPLIIPFLFSSYYRRLITVSTMITLPTVRNFLDLFFDDGIQLALTCYLIWNQQVNHPDTSLSAYTLLSVAGNVFSGIFSIVKIVSGLTKGCRTNIDREKARSLEEKLNIAKA